MCMNLLNRLLRLGVDGLFFFLKTRCMDPSFVSRRRRIFDLQKLYEDYIWPKFSKKPKAKSREWVKLTTD